MNATVSKQIDLKHRIDSDGHEIVIVKSTNNQPIPDDEPKILFRGRDRLALRMLAFYKRLCEEDGANDFQLEQVDEIISRFEKFAENHPEAMKQPGITRGK